MNRIVKGGLTLASGALIAFLATWEGGGNDGMAVYADQYANGLPTACYGLTHHVTSEPIIVGEYWSKEKCDHVMSVAVINVQTKMLDCLSHTPPQGVFDAVSSLAWNVGWPAACNSQSVRYINRRDYVTGCKLLANRFDGKPNWSYASGQFIKGLYNRRQAERDNLCLAGLYE